MYSSEIGLCYSFPVCFKLLTVDNNLVQASLALSSELHLSKSKIFLSGSMGRTMYGVVDDTGLLQYGQVFIQYSPSIRYVSERKIVYTGKRIEN